MASLLKADIRVGTPEGDNLFIFELRDGEWRITEWIDEAFSEEQIEAAR